MPKSLEISDCIAAINRFTQRWSEVIADDSNWAMSGLGAWIPLTTLLYGVDEGSRELLEDPLGIKQEQAATAISLISEQLQSIDALRLGIALWTKDDVEIKEEFAERFGSIELGPLPTQSKLAEWASTATQGMIRKFPLTVRPETLMVLAAAISAKSDWQVRFTSEKGSWCGKNLQGFLSRTSVKLDDVAIIRAGGKSYSRMIVASKSTIEFHLIAGEADQPASEVFAAAISALQGHADMTAGEKIKLGAKAGCLSTRTIHSETSKTSLRCSLPAFEVRQQSDLMEFQNQFGIQNLSKPPLNAKKHFPGISNSPLMINQGVQETLVRFKSQGFEAASVAAFEMIAASGALLTSTEALEIHVRHDRPFGFLAVDRISNLVLLSGWIQDPDACVSRNDNQYSIDVWERDHRTHFTGHAGTELTFGRSGENHHVFGDSAVSKQHLTIAFEHNSVTVTDHSRNGTRVQSNKDPSPRRIKHQSLTIAAGELDDSFRIKLGNLCHIEIRVIQTY